MGSMASLKTIRISSSFASLAFFTGTREQGIAGSPCCTCFGGPFCVLDFLLLSACSWLQRALTSTTRSSTKALRQGTVWWTGFCRNVGVLLAKPTTKALRLQGMVFSTWSFWALPGTILFRPKLSDPWGRTLGMLFAHIAMQTQLTFLLRTISSRLPGGGLFSNQSLGIHLPRLRHVSFLAGTILASSSLMWCMCYHMALLVVFAQASFAWCVGQWKFSRHFKELRNSRSESWKQHTLLSTVGAIA